MVGRSVSKPAIAIAVFAGSCSHRIRRCPFNLPHVVVQDRLLAAVIPFDGYTGPILCTDSAIVGVVVLPANTVADAKVSGLFAGHFFANSTRFMSPCPVKLWWPSSHLMVRYFAFVALTVPQSVS
jgi:hypothetical protein